MPNGSEEKEVEDYSPEEALREAMTQGLARVFLMQKDRHLFRIPLFHLGKKDISMLDLEKKATQDACFRASLFTAASLAKNATELFENIFVLKADMEDQKLPHQKNWIFHSFCIVETMGGKWIAISPANLHARDQETSRNSYSELQIEYTADSFLELTKILKDKEKIGFSDDQRIFSALNGTELKPEVAGQVVRKIPVIDYNKRYGVRISHEPDYYMHEKIRNKFEDVLKRLSSLRERI